MTSYDTDTWRKTSYSGNCVEVRFDSGAVLIRDSKYLRNPNNDPTSQPIAQWAAFLDQLL